jgi:hypothetical protein
MLGEGIVSFGVWRCDVTDRRNSKASPKIVSEMPIRPSTWSDGGANSMVPRALRKRTCSVASVTFEMPSSW